MLFSVLTSSAVGLAGLLIAAPAHVDALVTPGSGSELGHLAARRLAGVSPNHHALARRKTNAHKKRQRCQQRPVSPNSTPAPQETGTPNNVAADIYVGGDNNNNNPSNPTTTPPPPANTGTYTPPAVGGDRKLIVAWPNAQEDHISEFFTGKAGYYYNWSPNKAPGDPGNLRFCPMLWGDKPGENMIGKFTELVKPGYADCVLAMNEVNEPSQAFMDVGTGLWMWNTYIAPLKDQGYSILGSPATTSAPNGLVWIMDFLSQVPVKPTHICVHWYDVGFDNFKTYVENYRSNTGYLPILITEFACQNFNGGAQCSEGEVWQFVHAAVAWMDSTDWIHGYAPFGFMRQMQGVNDLNRLMTMEGHPTPLGSYFINGY